MMLTFQHLVSITTFHFVASYQMALNLDQPSSIHTFQSSPIEPKAYIFRNFQESLITMAKSPIFVD